MTDSVSLPAIALARVYGIFLFRRSHLTEHSLFLRNFYLICTICPILSRKGHFYTSLYDNEYSASKISLLLCKTFLYLQGLDSNLKIFLTSYFYETNNSLHFLNFQINRKANLYQVYLQAWARKISRDSPQDLYVYFTFFFG